MNQDLVSKLDLNMGGKATSFINGDLDDISNGIIALYTSANGHAPSLYGTILTFGGALEGSSFRNQLAISTDVHLFLRCNINTGGWGNWIQIC